MVNFLELTANMAVFEKSSRLKLETMSMSVPNGRKIKMRKIYENLFDQNKLNSKSISFKNHVPQINILQDVIT